MNSDRLRSLLHLLRTPGVGPTLAERLIRRFGDPQRALSASIAELQSIEGIGAAKARTLTEGFRKGADAADDELAHAGKIDARYLAIGEPEYPSLLQEIPRAPTLLSYLGSLDAAGKDRYSVAIVGSRGCTAYGMEQAERFAAGLADAGLTVISGGARGIDSAAHRGALRAGGRTIAVLGCGLARSYPPENADLFRQIADGHGAVASELPIATPPAPENFPARNRIISGLSLGVLVIEASARSGSLITARLAGDDHGRDVFALPGRVDSPSSEGSLDLLKHGGAHLVPAPGDVLSLLESPARHLHAGTHEARFAPGEADTPASLYEPPPPANDAQRRILEALTEPLTPDELSERSRLAPSALRAELTLLEIQGRIRRTGLQFERSGR